MAPRHAAPLLALALALLAAGPAAAQPAAAVPQCSWDGAAQLCDVSSAFILMNGSINVNDTAADALIRALARDALCNMIVEEAACTSSANVTCAWDEASVCGGLCRAGGGEQQWRARRGSAAWRVS
jgi:hypothetical protein